MTKTQYYLAKVRQQTGFSDYKVSKKYDINQSNLSKYSSGKAALSEIHAWLFADILQLNPAKVVAETKLEQAKINNHKSKIKFWQRQLKKLTEPYPLKISIAQINSIVGDISNNAKKIINLSLKASASGIHLLIFPELALIGYPPEDLLLRPTFIQQIEKEITLICNKIPSSMTVIFGAPQQINSNLYNSAYLIQYGKVRTYHKQILPNYGVFDEKRYFKAGDKTFVFECQQKKIGIIICEDAWSPNPINSAVVQGATTIISINASPFYINQFEQRLKIIKQRILENKIDFIYVNTVGGQDELVFDGGSFVINSTGNITHQLPFFKETIHNLDEPITSKNTPIEHTVYNSLVLSVRDYVVKNTIFKGAVIGLSGGVDSALTLAIAVDALGADNVHAIMMPYKYTANISIKDAKTQADIMKVKYDEIDITTVVNNFNDKLSAIFANTKTDTTEENLQSRIRGTILMAISNKFSKILLATSNKSEISVGYTTLYGDMAGGFAPIKDITKTLVYKLANYRNSISLVIPKRVIEREPSAELSYNQIDKDTLPPYTELDAILELLIAQKQSINQIKQQGFDRNTIKRIASMVFNNEHKRRQSPPGPKISANAFGKEWRYPITSKFKP